MNLFESLQIMHDVNHKQSLKLKESISIKKKIVENKSNDSIQLKEGITDIIDKIKQWFKTNKDNKQIKSILDKINTSGGDLDAYFKELVPSEGKANTVAGEMIRAIMRMQYRYYNDGDIFFIGYGLETAGPAASYLVDQAGINNIDEFAYMCSDKGYNHDGVDRIYQEFLNNITNEIIQIIEDQPNLLITPNEYDMFDWSGDEFKEYEPKLDLDVSIPSNVQYHLDEGHISERDLEWEIADWDNISGHEINVSNGVIYIYELTEDEFYELSRNNATYDNLESYGNELDEEYGSEEDEYDEEEDY